MITKTFSAPPIRVGNGTATFWITRRGIDLCGDDVDPDGIDVSLFKNNPVALWNHDSAHVIGRWSLPVRVGDGLQATLTFAGTSHAQEKRELVETGFVKSASIGFDPIEFVPIDPSRPRGGQLFKRALLIEVSIVATPAQPGATLIDFQDKAYRSRPTEETTMILTREQRMARAAEIVRRGEHPEPAGAPLPLTVACRIEDAKQMNEAARVLQENSQETRAARAARVAVAGRTTLLLDASIESAVREERSRKHPAPESPPWTRSIG